MQLQPVFGSSWTMKWGFAHIDTSVNSVFSIEMTLSEDNAKQRSMYGLVSIVFRHTR